MKKPSIAILHYSAPPVVGGVEAVIQAHVEVFVSEGHRTRVIAGRGDGAAYPSGADFQLIPEMDSQHPLVIEQNLELEKGVVPAQFNDLVDRLVENIEPHLHGYDWLIVHNIFTKHFNLPLTCALKTILSERVAMGCIAWCHDFTWTSPSSRSKVHPGFPWDLLREKWGGVTYVVVSKERQGSLAELFNCSRDDIPVVYNGVDRDLLLGLSVTGKYIVDRLGLFESDLILIMPVRVTKAKNIEFALEVLKAIKSKGLMPKLVLTGPPDPHDPDNIAYYRSLLRMRAALGLDAEMSFIYELELEGDGGYILDMATVSDLMRVSDLVFLPSHREGFGMPVLEAGMLGLQVVASEIPAVKEIANDYVTQIDISQTPEDVAERILGWASSDKRHQLRRRVRQSFTWEAIYRNEIRPLLASDGH